MKRIRNLVIIAVVLVAVIAIAVLNGKRGQTAVTVSVSTAHLTTFSSKLPENGIVQRPQVITIPTLVAGNLGPMYAKPGDYVSAGQLLAQVINPTLESNAAGSQADYQSNLANVTTARQNAENAKVTYQATLETAQSNLAEAMRIYKADLNLYQNKAIARTTVDADKAKVDQAQVTYNQAARQLRLGAVQGYGQNSVQYAEAAAQKAAITNQNNQQQLSFTRVTAPVSGIIQTVATQTNDPLTPIRPGDNVTAGQLLFTMAVGNDYIVKAQVDEQDVINVRVGQAAQITGEDFPGKTLTGHVVAIAPVAIKSSDANSTARQVLTTIRLDRPESFLRDGMSVDVDILTTNIRNALTIPSGAIATEGKRSYVYVIRGKRAVKTYVTTGSHNETETIIRSGLAAGDRVVSAQNALLHDGSTVAVAVSPQP